MMFTLRAYKKANRAYALFSRQFAQAHGEHLNNAKHDPHAAKHHDSHDKHHDSAKHHDDHHDHHYEDLSIYEAKLKDYRHMIPEAPESDNKYSLQMLIANNTLTKSKSFLNFFAEQLQYSKVENQAEYFSPPKIHENSVFLYQSRNLANSVRTARGGDYAALFFVGAVLHEPLFALVTFGVFYTIFLNAYFYEMNRRLVTRMDLLPHLEMVHFQKVTAFGEVYSKLVRIENLEKVDIESIRPDENYFWAHNMTLDVELIFRDKETKELFCFDRSGNWDWKGISHELLY